MNNYQIRTEQKYRADQNILNPEFDNYGRSTKKDIRTQLSNSQVRQDKMHKIKGTVKISKQQQVLHNKILQKYCSIYLGQNEDPVLLKIKQKYEEDMKNKIKIHINETEQENKFMSYMKQKNHNIQKREQNLQQKNQIIKKLKENSFLKIAKSKPQNQSFEDLLNYQHLTQFYKSEKQDQQQIIKAYQQKIIRQRNQPKNQIKSFKLNAYVPSFIDQLVTDIKKFNVIKEELKVQFFNTQNIKYLEEILQLNQKLLKPTLQEFLFKVLELKNKEQLANIDIQLQIMISLHKSEMIEGRSKKQLLNLFINNVRSIHSQQRQYQLSRKSR